MLEIEIPKKYVYSRLTTGIVTTTTTTTIRAMSTTTMIPSYIYMLNIN